jgi:nucleotide-binding universal stress UspA family protein
MTSVIAAIDNSAAARPVLAAALALGDVLGAGVEAIHVTEDDGHTARASAKHLGVPFRRLPGDPLAQIVEQAAQPGVVAVAIGTRRGMTRHGVGHLALAVADGVHRPVLVVPPHAAPPARFRTALVAMEGTRDHAHAIKAAVDLAAATDLELVVVHVDDESSIPGFSDQLAHETDAYAAEFLARYVPGAPTARFEPRVGAPAEEIMATCAAVGADVIALGWPKSPDPSRGAVVREVLHRSSVPVLLVALAGDEGDGPREGV